MPARCSAPNCRSGYDGEEPIPIFKMRYDFTDSEKDHWRIFLHRADSASLKHVYLCTKHFHPWEVLYTCEALLPDDWILVVSFTLCILYSLSTFDSFPSFVTWLHIAFTKSWFCYCIPFIEVLESPMCTLTWSSVHAHRVQ